MKGTLISMLAVAVLAAAICVFSLLQIGHVSDEMEKMRISVLKRIDAGDWEGAREELGQMKEMWGRHENVLEMLASHDDLHEITELIIESAAHLDAGDPDDFTWSMALLGEAIGHLHREERLGISNIL